MGRTLDPDRPPAAELDVFSPVASGADVPAGSSVTDAPDLLASVEDVGTVVLKDDR